MKKLVYLLICFLLIQVHLTAQDPDGHEGNVGVNLFALKKDGIGYNTFTGGTYNARVVYYDAQDVELAREDINGVVGPGSSIWHVFGNGTNQNPPNFLIPSFWDAFHHGTVDGQIDDGIGPLEFNTTFITEEIIHSIKSERTNAISKFTWEDQYLESFENILNPMPGMRSDFAVMKESLDGLNPNRMGRFEFNQLVNVFERVSAYNENITFSTIRVNPCPIKRAWMIGGQQDRQESWADVFIPKDVAELYNGVAFHIGPGIFGRTDPHPIAAIYGNNSENEMGTGVFGKGYTVGVYGQGQNGTIGVTNSDRNGSALTAFIGAPPAAGGFKYGMYANSNSQPSSWAAAVFGSGFYTGSWMMSSDEKLKTDVNPQEDALDKVMQLKPTVYKYRSNTPYNFTDKMHHGFLAQDVETIFPELVADIPMPTNTEPEKMYYSPVEHFKGIDYTGMISILTSALQELNTVLTARIDAQAAEIESLRKLIDD